MKKLIIALAAKALLLTPDSPVLSQNVDFQSAEKASITIAKKVHKHYRKQNNIVVDTIICYKNGDDNLLYIVNFQDSSFIILSGDYSIKPFLGESMNSKFDPETINPGLEYLLNKYINQITDFKKSKDYKKNFAKKNKWDELLDETIITEMELLSGGVEPMLEDYEWGQGDPWNRSCPTIDGVKPWVGCTAVAMAQIIRYWQCSAIPNGIHTNVNWPGGSEVANFNNGYNWLNIYPSQWVGQTPEFLHDCANGIDMEYGLSGSTAWLSDARDCLVDHFYFSSNADVKQRLWHLLTWPELIKNNLDQGRPILYTGYETVTHRRGHTWTISGYTVEDEFFCNWGWEGDNNGYFALDAFDPDSTGTTYSGYNQWEEALFDIYPTKPEPQIQDQIINTGDNIITIPPVPFANSYSWTTEFGTITGSTNTATLNTQVSTTVSVKANLYYCQICTSSTDWKSAYFTVGTPTLTGPSILCTGTNSFTLNNNFQQSTVYWSKSSNIDWDGTPGMTGCNVAATGSNFGPGYLSADIVVNGYIEGTAECEFWVGPPASFSITGPTEIAIGTNYSYSIPYNAVESSDFQTTWTLTGPITLNSSTYQGCNLTATSCGPATLTATLHNCYNNTTRSLNIYVDCYQPVVYPNPANEILYLDPNYSQVDAVDFQFDLINESGLKKMEKTSTGEVISISIGSLPEGSYFVKAKMNKKDGTKTEKTIPIVIKH